MPSLPDAVLKNAQINPLEEFIIGANMTLTFAEFKEEVGKATNYLLRQGIRHGNIVGVGLTPEAELIFLSALDYIGATSAIVRTTEQRESLASYGFTHFVQNKPLDSHLGVTCLTVQPKELSGLEHRIEEPSHEWQSDEHYRVFFTSGTTGTPKAVPVSKKVFDFRVQKATKSWMANGQMISLFGLDVSMTQLLFNYSAYSCIPFHAPGDAQSVRREISRGLITSVIASESHLNQMRETGLASFESVTQVSVAGSFPPPSLRDEVEDMFPNATLHIFFGSSETGHLFFTKLEKTGRNLGIPVEGVQVSLMLKDPNEDSIGFIFAKGESLASEYLGDENLSSIHFVDGGFLFGDLASAKPNGEYEYLGRGDNVINLEGHKISTEILEELVESAFPGLVVVISNSQNKLRIKYSSSTVFSENSLREFLMIRLGHQDTFELLRVPNIPLTSTGKKIRVN